MLLRNLHQEYTFNSTYALFPLIVPGRIEEDLRIKNGGSYDSHYDFSRPKPVEIAIVSDQRSIGHILNNPRHFPTCYAEDLRLLSKGYG